MKRKGWATDFTPPPDLRERRGAVTVLVMTPEAKRRDDAQVRLLEAALKFSYVCGAGAERSQTETAIGGAGVATGGNGATSTVRSQQSAERPHGPLLPHL